jgi:hypothetical protein
MQEKDETGGQPNVYYFFVRLNEGKRPPDFWVIPSSRVNSIVSTYRKIWEQEQNLKSTNKTEMRRLCVRIPERMKKYFPNVDNKEMDSYYKNLEPILN